LLTQNAIADVERAVSGHSNATGVADPIRYRSKRRALPGPILSDIVATLLATYSAFAIATLFRQQRANRRERRGAVAVFVNRAFDRHGAEGSEMSGRGLQARSEAASNAAANRADVSAGALHRP
jgi:hypothetical protein